MNYIKKEDCDFTHKTTLNTSKCSSQKQVSTKIVPLYYHIDEYAY
jgi:hypothetical protein